MVDVTIDDLLAIGTTQLREANTIIQQAGVSFKAPTRPNPDTQINVSSQAQLEAELGTNIEIADGDRIVVVIDAAFTLTKPFKLGLNSALELYSSVNGGFLTYTGTGALFQNTNPANITSALNLHNLNITGDTTNSVFDIIGNSAIEVRNVVFSTFDSIGTITSAAVIFELVAFIIFTTQGLVIRDTPDVSILRSSLFQITETGMTFVSIVTATKVNVDIDIVRALNFFAADSLVFFDPNSPVGSIYTIEKSKADPGNLYKPGVTTTVDSVFDNGGGLAEFATIVAHGLAVGDFVAISGFTTNTAYNGTFIVTVADTNTFETGVAFGTNEAGNMDGASLDSTDPIVFAEGNNGALDSSTIAEASTSGVLEVDGSSGPNDDVPIVDITPAPGDWVEDASTERFTVDTTTGIVTYIGITPITVMIKYSLSASQTSGSAQTVLFDLHINGILQTKTGITIVTSGVGSPVAGVYNGGNFVIDPGDTFQLFKDNTTNTNNTDITNATLLINLD